MLERYRLIFLMFFILLPALESPALAAGQQNLTIGPMPMAAGQQKLTVNPVPLPKGQQKLISKPTPEAIERQLILETLRSKVKHLRGLDVVFVVKYLKVHNGWAWVHTLPQSGNGLSRYEDVSALLRKDGSTWKVAEIACTEGENDQCLGSPGYFSLLKKRFPHLPPGILPE